MFDPVIEKLWPPNFIFLTGPFFLEKIFALVKCKTGKVIEVC